MIVLILHLWLGKKKKKSIENCWHLCSKTSTGLRPKGILMESHNRLTVGSKTEKPRMNSVNWISHRFQAKTKDIQE